MSILNWLRLVEQDNGTAELNDLYQQRDALLKQWQSIKATEPPTRDTGQGYSVHTPDSHAWSVDPERGLFWNQRIYPINQKIEQVEAAITKQRRQDALKAKRGSDEGFDTSEILYHGTDTEFENFDRSKVRTAAHIYTSPEIETARHYGHIIYAVYGRQEPQAVLTAEDMDYDLARRLHRRGAFRKHWGLSLVDLTELISNGELYSYNSNSRLQDDVIDTCLSMKYKSVRISDPVPGGGYSDSVIFSDINDLQIVERVDE